LIVTPTELERAMEYTIIANKFIEPYDVREIQLANAANWSLLSRMAKNAMAHLRGLDTMGSPFYGSCRSRTGGVSGI
jgi:hypothetical protein